MRTTGFTAGRWWRGVVIVAAILAMVGLWYVVSRRTPAKSANPEPVHGRLDSFRKHSGGRRPAGGTRGRAPGNMGKAGAVFHPWDKKPVDSHFPPQGNRIPEPELARKLGIPAQSLGRILKPPEKGPPHFPSREPQVPVDTRQPRPKIPERKDFLLPPSQQQPPKDTSQDSKQGNRPLGNAQGNPTQGSLDTAQGRWKGGDRPQRNPPLQQDSRVGWQGDEGLGGQGGQKWEAQGTQQGAGQRGQQWGAGAGQGGQQSVGGAGQGQQWGAGQGGQQSVGGAGQGGQQSVGGAGQGGQQSVGGAGQGQQWGAGAGQGRQQSVGGAGQGQQLGAGAGQGGQQSVGGAGQGQQWGAGAGQGGQQSVGGAGQGQPHGWQRNKPVIQGPRQGAGVDPSIAQRLGGLKEAGKPPNGGQGGQTDLPQAPGKAKVSPPDVSTLNLQGPIPSVVKSVFNAIKVDTKHIKIRTDMDIVYREALPNGVVPKLHILLLHGASFSSQIWEKLQTLQYIAAMGHRAVAIDIPGSPRGESTGSIITPHYFMIRLMKALNVSDPVIVSPSMSGKYSLPFLVTFPNRVTGFVALAPVDTATYVSKYRDVATPTLIVYGTEDKNIGPESVENLSNLPNHQVLEISRAGHPAYVDEPAIWHTALYNFLEALCPQ